jgi:hypothetical protein
MSEKPSGIIPAVACAAKYFLWMSAVFCLGVAVAQQDVVKRAFRYVKSGTIQAEMLPYARDPIDRQITVWGASPDVLAGGAVLVSAQYSTHLGLLLIGGDGKILHRWYAEDGDPRPGFFQWWKIMATDDGHFSIDDAHLLPNGDVIFNEELSKGGSSQRKLVRMDKNSHVLWQVMGSFHHVMDIAGDPALIYTVTSHYSDALPVLGPKLKEVGYLDDWVEVYTLDGKKISEWSISQALDHSPYRSWLANFEIDVPWFQRVREPDGRMLYDPMHINSVQYLDASKAKALPFTQAGDLLLSFRGLNALVVFRPAGRQVVWAGGGPWRHQHNAHVEEDGSLMVFDNEGSREIMLKGGEPVEKLQSRLMRYNPFTYTFDEVIASPLLHSYLLGSYQRLADGVWIICSPQRSRVVVVSPKKEIMWELRAVAEREQEVVPIGKQLGSMRYYPISALSFLHADTKRAP